MHSIEATSEEMASGLSFTLSPRKDPLAEPKVPEKGFREKWKLKNLCKDLEQLSDAWRPLPFRKSSSLNANPPKNAKEIIPHCGLAGLKITPESEHCRLVKLAKGSELLEMHEQITKMIVEAATEGIVEEDLCHYKPLVDDTDNTCPKPIWKFIVYCEKKMSLNLTKYLVQHRKPAEDEEIYRIVKLIINLERVRHYVESMGEKVLGLYRMTEDAYPDEIREEVEKRFNTVLRALLDVVNPYFKDHPLDTLTYPIIEKSDCKLLKAFGKAHFTFCRDEISLTKEVLGSHLTVSPMVAGPWFKMWEKMACTPASSNLAKMGNSEVPCGLCRKSYREHDIGVIDSCNHYHCIECIKVLVKDRNGNTECQTCRHEFRTWTEKEVFVKGVGMLFDAEVNCCPQATYANLTGYAMAIPLSTRFMGDYRF